MDEIIKVVSEDGKECVSARELHAALEVGRDFSTWIKERINEYGFDDGTDFTTNSLIPRNGGIKKRGGDRKSKDYIISIDMAKELAMIEKTPKGRDVRKWFIDRENKLKEAERKAIEALNKIEHDYIMGKLDDRLDSALEEITYIYAILIGEQGKRVYNIMNRIVYDKIDRVSKLYNK